MSGLLINENEGYRMLMMSLSVTTALTHYIGYREASRIARLMTENKIDIHEACSVPGFTANGKLNTIPETGKIHDSGFSPEYI